MPYPGQFHRLVMIGTLYAEQFNMTLNIVPSALGELGMPEVDDPTLAAVAADAAAWFALSAVSGGPAFIFAAKLASIKLNRIGTDGRYVDNEAQEHVYTTPIAGDAGGTNIAPQLSSVVTLKTAIERGRGSKGRVYLVPSAHITSLGTDGRLTTTQATAVATGMKNLIDRLNTTYSLVGRVGVASNAGAGRFEHVTHLAVGRVLDTMRSRRASLAEDYQELVI